MAVTSGAGDTGAGTEDCHISQKRSDVAGVSDAEVLTLSGATTGAEVSSGETEAIEMVLAVASEVISVTHASDEGGMAVVSSGDVRPHTSGVSVERTSGVDVISEEGISLVGVTRDVSVATMSEAGVSGLATTV